MFNLVDEEQGENVPREHMYSVLNNLKNRCILLTLLSSGNNYHLGVRYFLFLYGKLRFFFTFQRIVGSNNSVVNELFKLEYNCGKYW